MRERDCGGRRGRIAMLFKVVREDFGGKFALEQMSEPAIKLSRGDVSPSEETARAKAAG